MFNLGLKYIEDHFFELIRSTMRVYFQNAEGDTCLHIVARNRNAACLDRLLNIPIVQCNIQVELNTKKLFDGEIVLD